jgi:hypothetical protein
LRFGEPTATYAWIDRRVELWGVRVYKNTKVIKLEKKIWNNYKARI